MVSILDLSRCFSSMMGRAVKAESMAAPLPWLASQGWLFRYGHQRRIQARDVDGTGIKTSSPPVGAAIRVAGVVVAVVEVGRLLVE